MKFKFSELLTVILFCGFIFIMMILYIALPKKEFSENEKRFLPEFPEIYWDAVSDGSWGEDIEEYLAEHIPGRNFFVGLDSYFELYTGRQVSKDIWLKNGYLVEAPVIANENAITQNMHSINEFAKAIGQDVDLAIVPSAGWAMGLEGYDDAEIIDSIYSLAGSDITTVNMTSTFAGHPELFYKTDHHWNSSGAHRAYLTYMESSGRWAKSESEFEKTVVDGFQGSTYSRSALWLTEPEAIELWYGSDSITVTNGESDEVHTGPFYLNRLEEADKYTVFLDGNHSVVRVHNPEQDGKLLVIRDSYSNSLGCFLAESYGEVVLVDLRYYKLPISELAAQESFDDVLICYSIGNFIEDTNIIWLR